MCRFQIDKRLSAATLDTANIVEGVTDMKGFLVVDEVAIDDLHRAGRSRIEVLGSLEVDEVQDST